MPRKPRLIEEGAPHHITQRGNRKELLFFDQLDRVVYKKLLKKFMLLWQVEILAYCLMTNHIHLILVPSSRAGLIRMMNTVQTKYAFYINQKRKTCGHTWHSRYFCSPLDHDYMWTAIRYVELNPVRANMVEFAEDYPWSSARFHCDANCFDSILTHDSKWANILAMRNNWQRWLREDELEENINIFRKQHSQDLPCGSEEFIAQLEKKSGRKLRYTPVGRPV